MPTRSTEYFENFAYEGALGWNGAALTLLGLALFIAWLLWCERKILGRGVAGLFFVLRTLAVAVVLWMLLGPTHVATERTTIPQTLVILLDSSQSMDVAEPMPAAESLRWQQVRQGESANHPELIAIDKVVADLQHATHKFEQALTLANEFAPAETTVQQLEAVGETIDRAIGHLSKVAAKFSAYGEKMADLAVSLSEGLDRDARRLVNQSAGQFAPGSELSGKRAQSMQLLEESLERCLRRSEVLQRNLVTSLIASGATDVEYAAQSPTRKALSLASLNALDQSVLAELAKTVNIKRITVDEFAVPLAGDTQWPTSIDNSAEPSNLGEEGLPSGFDLAEAGRGQGASMGPITNLTAALEMLSQEAASESIVAAVVYSDGGHNAPGTTAPIRVASSLVGLPVHVLPVCSHQPQRDLQIHSVDAPESVGLNDSIVIEALITGFYLDGEQTSVELRRRGKLVDSRVVKFSGDRQDHRLRFTTPADELGQHEFDIVAASLDDETSVTNNAAVLSVRVVRDSIRVLLADRISRWEYRYLDMLFRRDKHVEFDKLLFSPTVVATGELAAAEELPRDVEAWSQYDVAILGDLEPKSFDYEQQDAMATWVRERGGQVVVIAGRQHMPHAYAAGPLVELLPVQKSPRLVLDRNGYLPSITPTGAMHDAVMLERTPDGTVEAWATPFRSVPIYYVSPICLPKPAAHTLIEAAVATDEVKFASSNAEQIERALFAWQSVGAGRVACITSPVTYHLRFRHGDALHHRFWGQTLRWLTAAERGRRQNQLFVRTTDTRYEYGQTIEVAVSLSHQDGSPMIEEDIEALADAPGGELVATSLQADSNVPGRYLGRFENLEPGAYRITASGRAIEALDAEQIDSEGATALVTVYAPDNIEMTNTRGNRPLLEEIAAVTGGQVLPPTAVDEILQLSALSPRVIENAERTPLWNRWRYFWVVVGCLVSEWAIRRMIGLV